MALLVVAVAGGVVAWSSFDTGARFLSVVVVLVGGVGIFLARSSDL